MLLLLLLLCLCVFEQLGSAGPFCNTGERVYQEVGMLIHQGFSRDPSILAFQVREEESMELGDTVRRSCVFPSVNSR